VPGVYVSYPFCAQKCTYCNFASGVFPPALKARYLGALAREIRARAGVPVGLSDACGVPAAYREAAGMAVLGALCQDRVPLTLPQVTGVRGAPVAGCWVLP
jgi:oxygen-independent coproporphyrinogen-3 oxidase